MLEEVTAFHVETVGRGPRVVLVHGSVGNSSTWEQVRRLSDRYTLVLPDRPGSPPNPQVERVDFEEHAELLAPLLERGAHLVGNSYGGVISLFVAGLRPAAVRSLTVIEPPCFGVARGHPAVDRLIARLSELWTDGPNDPSEFLALFGSHVLGRARRPEPLSRETEQGVRTLMVERGPWEAEPPLDALAAAPFPKLVVSGGHSAAFDAVCDVLERRLGAERAVLPGARHNPQTLPRFAELLSGFLSRSDAGRSA
jgi:pimeloyl-ACP methyl ester carboxylesterase